MAKDPQLLTVRQRQQLEGLFTKDTALRTVFAHIQGFCQMVRTCGGATLERWLENVEQGPVQYGQAQIPSSASRSAISRRP